MSYQDLYDLAKEDNFIIYSASAGTGKTHTITKEELTHILNTQSISFISNTFTNAAAKEMKERLIEYLIEMASADDIMSLKSNPLYKDILESSKNISKEKIETILLNILNNYSMLTINTIDSLCVRLLRAYQDKTGFSDDISILLDNEEFLREMISKSLINDPDFLGMGYEQKIEYLKQIIRLISSDNIRTDIIDSMIKEINKINTTLICQDQESIIEEKVQLEDFKKVNKKEALKLLDEILNEQKYLQQNPINYYNELKDSINSGDKFIPKEYKRLFLKEADQRKQNEIKPKINSLNVYASNLHFIDLLTRYLPYSQIYNKYLQYFKQISPFLTEIPLKFLYMELIPVINNIEDINLRLGRDFEMVLTDEFQDTSPEQLKILTRLFKHALRPEEKKRKGKVVIVGDTKQAIYSFRGGDYKALSTLIDKFKHKINTLNTNFRSRENIVEFIAKLFPREKEIQSICETLDFENKNKEESSIYTNAFKKIGAFDQHRINYDEENKGGYVEINTYGISFKDLISRSTDNAFSDTDMENVYTDIYKCILDIKNRGYLYRDICIITPKNEDVIEIASSLLSRNIPVKSHSSLDARERPISKEIISLMRYAIDSQNQMSLYLFLNGTLCSNKVKKLSFEDEYNRLLKKFKEDPQNFRFDKDSEIYKICFDEILSKANTISAYEMLLLIYRTFDVTSPEYFSEQAAYMTLLDAAINIENSDDNTIKTFIDHFEDEGDSETLKEADIWTMNVSESIDAINIATIHKMKGLEFPIVFYVYKRKTEKNPEKSPYIVKYNNKNYLIKFAKDDTFTINNCSLLDRTVKDELNQKEEEYNIDNAANNINLHYVALTRAKDELYIFLYNGERSKAGTKSIFTSLIYNYIKKYIVEEKGKQLKSADKYKFTIGKPEKKRGEEKVDNPLMIDNFTIPKSENIYLKSFLNRDEQARYGTAVHSVLANIQYLNDSEISEQINDAILRAERSGTPIKDKENIINEIKWLSENNDTKWIFSHKSGRIIKNEFEFVNKSGDLFRADRVIFDNDIVYVIDYKSGNPTADERKEYHKQVKNYLDILNKIYNKKSEGIIIYLTLHEIERI